MALIENAHHGTSKESGQAIVSQQLFIVGEAETLWLGNGAYFFKDNKKMAKEWCISEGYKKGYDEYSIIEAHIDAKEKQLFDLNEPENRDIFHSHREIVKNRLRRSRFRAQGYQKFFDGQVINDICEIAQYKVVIQDMFVQLSEDRILKVLSRVPNCTVVSVRDPDYIKAPKIIEEGVLNG